MSLEQLLLARAGELPEPRWRNPLFDSLVEARDLERFVVETEELIDLLWEVYSGTPVVEGEVTTESVVGHRLLRDGMQGWLDALELAARGDREGALAAAEDASRLLAVLQQFSFELKA